MEDSLHELSYTCLVTNVISEDLCENFNSYMYIPYLQIANACAYTAVLFVYIKTLPFSCVS